MRRRHRTGFEEAKDFPIRMNDLIAGRYQVVDFLGSAAFSRAVQALDVKTNMLVCLKIIKVRGTWPRKGQEADETALPLAHAVRVLRPAPPRTALTRPDQT